MGLGEGEQVYVIKKWENPVGSKEKDRGKNLLLLLTN